MIWNGLFEERSPIDILFTTLTTFELTLCCVYVAGEKIIVWSKFNITWLVVNFVSSPNNSILSFNNKIAVLYMWKKFIFCRIEEKNCRYIVNEKGIVFYVFSLGNCIISISNSKTISINSQQNETKIAQSHRISTQMFRHVFQNCTQLLIIVVMPVFCIYEPPSQSSSSPIRKLS